MQALAGYFHILFRLFNSNKLRENRFATAAVVPEPENGSTMRSPGFEVDRITLEIKLSGFCVGWALWPFLFNRSAPVQSGSNPITSHLQPFIKGLHRIIVKSIPFADEFFPHHMSVSCAFVNLRPLKFGMGFRFTPDNVIKYPKP